MNTLAQKSEGFAVSRNGNDEGIHQVSLDSVITTEQLSRRPARAPLYEAETRAMASLLEALAKSPEGILQKLVEAALNLCGAHSAGVSLLNEKEKRFYWPAIAGQWAAHVGGGTPRDFGPCGTVLDRNATLLFSHPERHFPYLAVATPYVEEALLVPFYVDGKAVGTVWVVAHDQSRQFDAEDQRLMDSLARFASSAYQVLATREALKNEVAEHRQAEARCRQMLDALPAAIYTTDAEGRLTHFNAAAVEFSGRTPELGTDSWCVTWKLYYPDGTPMPHDKCPMAIALKEGRAIRGAEAIAERPDGKRVWFTPFPTPLRDAEGRIVGGINMLMDITERKRGELEVRKRSEQLQILSEALAHLLSARDADRVVRELFPKVSAHLGVDTYFNFIVNAEGDALTLHSYAGIARQTAKQIERLEFGQAIAGTVAETKQAIVATDIQNSDDDNASLVRSFGIQACACNPLIGGERLLGTLSFASRTRTHFEDDELEFMRVISRYVAVAMERVRSEKELQEAHDLLADKAKHLELLVQQRTARLQEVIGELESFSYSISHDMRAPLRAMQSFAKILDEDCGERVGAEGKDYIRRIVAGANRMDKLIRDVLTYSRVARTEYNLGPVELGSLLKGILESYPTFRRPDAEIEIAATFPKVMGNEAALTQCISNLIGNAVKFVPHGTVAHVRVWAESRNGRAHLFVQDNGIGIPAEAQNKIFGIFQRFTKEYEGTGIGLAIVKKAVERMGGRVGYESAPGKGSKFWLELKVAKETD